MASLIGIVFRLAHRFPFYLTESKEPVKTYMSGLPGALTATHRKNVCSESYFYHFTDGITEAL